MKFGLGNGDVFNIRMIIVKEGHSLYGLLGSEVYGISNFLPCLQYTLCGIRVV